MVQAQYLHVSGNITGDKGWQERRFYQEGKGVELGKFLSTGPRFPRYHRKEEMLTQQLENLEKTIPSRQSCFESGLAGTMNERAWGSKHTRKLCAVGVDSAQ